MSTRPSSSSTLYAAQACSTTLQSVQLPLLTVRLPLLTDPPCAPLCHVCCSGARSYQEWFDFLGLIKDKRFPPAGSPFQMNFPPEATTPRERSL